MKPRNKILLSFDVEEFDLPLEYGRNIDVKDQLAVGLEGLNNIMPVLQMKDVEATLFTTAFFAENFPDVMQQLSARHEIASHTYYHNKFDESDLTRSRIKLEQITGKKVLGLRMPRMKPVSSKAVINAGYTYNSSVNPCWVPGRYNNLHISRTFFYEEKLLQLPVSVTPRLRIPLFWLSFKNMPYSLYLRLALQVLKKDGYICLYFHPWEFSDIGKYRLPSYVSRCPVNLLKNLKKLITDLSLEGTFVSTAAFIEDNSCDC